MSAEEFKGGIDRRAFLKTAAAAGATVAAGGAVGMTKKWDQSPMALT